MSPIPSFDYNLLYGERVLRSVANNTRQDGGDFLRLAAEIPIHTETEVFPLREANRALNSLKNDAIRGAACFSWPELSRLAGVAQTLPCMLAPVLPTPKSDARRRPRELPWRDG